MRRSAPAIPPLPKSASQKRLNCGAGRRSPISRTSRSPRSRIARLDELRLLTVEARLEAKLALGRHVDVIPELESLIEAEPLRERPRAQLMVALYRAGRQADALAVFRSTRTKLVDELGIEPGPELRELEAAILRQDASLRPTAAYAAGATYRRLVTILVVSIDTLTLTATLDPEAAAEVSQRFVAAFTSTVARHGGRREESASDTMVAAFGVPLSHEDDACGPRGGASSR